MKKWIVYGVGAVVGVVVIGCGVLMALGHRSGAGRIEAAVVIDRAPEQIWPWLREPDKLTQWVSWLLEVQQATPQQSGVGTRQVWVMEDRNNGNQRMRIDGTYMVYEPPRRLVMHTASGDAFSGEYTYVLAPEEGGRTRVEIAASYTMYHPLAKLLEPVITPQADKKLEADLAALKTKVEASNRTAASAQP